MNAPPDRPTFWQTVRIIWSYARRRAAGRKAHQKALLSRKSKNSGATSAADPFGCLGTVFMLIFAVFLHGMFGNVVHESAMVAMRVDAERHGQMAIPRGAYDTLKDAASLEAQGGSDETVDKLLDKASELALQDLPREERKNSKPYFDRFFDVYNNHGLAGFVVFDARSEDAQDPRHWPPLVLGMIGSCILIWFGMLVCQGEGVEFDVQRRRHPVWEWLLSHPVRPAAVIVAETLSPFIANPLYYAAPAFWIVLLVGVFDFGQAAIAGTVIGLALAVAASSLNKSIEAVAMLRLSVRNRGAVLGIMSWLGFAGMFMPLLLMRTTSWEGPVIRACAAVLSWFPAWPVRALLGGSGRGVEFSAGSGLILALGFLALSLIVARFAMARGLDSGTSIDEVAPESGLFGAVIGKFDPVFRKELLWFRRDRGAIVQAILIPLTLAAFQAFNLRTLTQSALQYWQAFCGTAILCGTYFLFVLGPRSLASEGAALWIPLTWPRGLEDLLRAKARLWAFLANCIVGLLLAVGAWRFPDAIWKIGLVAVGWFFFCRGMAMRSVTLVSPTSESGEVRPLSAGNRYVATVGMLTFTSGVFAQNWHVAIMGVVFTLLVAAACWQNLRARLPFLFDPWSEKLAPAPSLVHAMIGIALLVEVVGITLSIASGFGGRDMLNWTMPLAYGITGCVGWLIMRHFLSGRGVTDHEIWNWLPAEPRSRLRTALLGAGAGVALGLVGLGYIAVLWKIPAAAEWLRHAGENNPLRAGQGKIGFQIMAIALAPVAEEYFFRGLLYRALDREWAGARAMLGSAAYFAIYHPPISWLPVFALGVLNAWMFRRTRMLLPCVCAHIAYNAIVVGLQ